ncbi:MAG: hypothetical protein LBI41_00460 [Lactobacillales bacterium]|jgi:hypothetical protein|nr:hypothetical protein [Lactobacillales bacterium]
MSNKLLELITKDQKVLKKIIKSKDRNDALAIAQENISNYTEENFKKDIEELEKIMRGDDRLDKEQLDSVTGGASSVQQLGIFSEKHGVDFGELLKGWQ